MRTALTVRNAAMLAVTVTVAVVAAGVVAAVVIRGGGEAEPGGESAAARATTTTAGPAAPAFNVETVDGTSFSLAAQRGKVVVLDFLQAGCPSCAVEVPVLEEVATRFAGRGVAVLIVDVSGAGDSELRRYYRGELGASKRVLIAADRGFRVAGSYRPSSMPAGFVIDGDGRIAWRGMVGGTSATLVREIRAARST